MKLPYSWIKELSGVDWSSEEMADRLTLSGTAGTAESANPEHFENVVTGKITRLEQHPDADKLKVAVVDSGDAEHTVICGAPNCAVGQVVVLALPGANLRGEFAVKEITMRGVRSAGIICAEDEIGLSDDHTGIMVLGEDTPLGVPVFDHLGLDDAIIDFEITPNRPDCLCAIGVAREVAVLAEKEMIIKPAVINESDRQASDYISVKIDDPDGCPRYTAKIIENVTIGQSPWWLRKRLIGCGIRPINNIVDITNYVMMETGHPLHAFDYDRFGSKEVVVRFAKPGEKFTTLDEKAHELDETILLITNGKTGVAAAGVMGGLESEVEEDTRTILLEAAYFDPAVIRRGAKKLVIPSESSYRFERGVDPNGLINAADRAASLMAEIAAGEVHAGTVDCYPKKITPVSINLRPMQVKRFVGVDIPVSFMETTLRGLGLEVGSGEVIKTTVPTYRPDLTREIDIIEEIARVYGLDKIPNSKQNAGPLFTPLHRRDTIKNDLRNVMTGFGFEETIGSGMAHFKRQAILDSEIEPVKITNPLSDEFAVMRTRLLYSMLQSAGNNIRHRNMDIKIFEIGRVYQKSDAEPIENESFGFLMTGNLENAYWKDSAGRTDLFEAKGILEALAETFGVGSLTLKPAQCPGYMSAQSFDIMFEDLVAGHMGLVDRRAGRLFDIKQDCYAAELNTELLIKAYQGLKEFRPMPKYPASSRDIALLVDESIPAEKLQDSIVSSGGEYVEAVSIFDLFAGGPVPEGKKSLAFSITFRSADKTLEDKEVDEAHGVIVDYLKKNFNALLRE
jgi:phenylalanyl-tRNA synthetase beta chain